MNNEIIISTIENYIDTLENPEIELYKKALNRFDNNEGRTFYIPVESLALLVSTLKRELAESEIKKSKGNTFLKRSKLAEKIIMSNSREELRSGWIEDEKQYFMTPYYGFMLTEKLEITMTKSGNHPVRL